MPNENKGVIYVLSNRSMQGYFKIGKCAQNKLRERMRNLYSSGVPLPFECEYAKIVDDYERVEKALHRAFSVDRYNDNREFFKTTPERIVAILDLLDGEEITHTVRQRIEENTTNADRVAQARTRRSNLNFQEMGIPVGGIITFLSPDDTNYNIQVKVADSRHVEYDGQIVSLTSLTKQLLHIEGPLRPTGYWAYNGRSLLEIYEDSYSISSEE